mmetsp:Transcript_34519/g.101448  ORF Transcript_34519/g.101448 Transcript_34519/m.101448 type:complete len:280 (+) Transcript_34519:84-923(+)
MSKYESLPTATATPVVAVATPLIEVTAPATLSAGYTFDASLPDGRIFKVQVPAGGVTEGQRFSVPLPGDLSSSTPLVGEGGATLGGGPKYHWKDALCGCCNYGICHPSLWNAMICPLILMAQVATRMKLNWLGSPAEGESWRNTFKIIVSIVVVHYVISGILAPFKPDYEYDEKSGEMVQVGPDAPLWVTIVNNIVSASFGLYSLIVMIKVRRSVRQRYEIEPECCGGAEDCCCVFFCNCCTVAQMARHTADYEQRRAVCCTSTGMPDSPPELKPVMVV